MFEQVDAKLVEMRRIASVPSKLKANKKIFEYNFVAGFAKRIALRRDADMCFLTRIEGNLDGEGELLEIYTRNGVWFLEARNGHKNAPVKAGVTCIKYSIMPQS